jgi:6-phosphogluconate dehydrogenase
VTTKGRNMEIGLYGLGRMGANMVRRLARSGEHHVVAGNRSPSPVDEAVSEGVEGAYSMEEMVEKLSPPRAIWTMVPAGDITEGTLLEFAGMMDEGDILIDGGNSYFRDSIRRAEMLHERGLRFLDAGTSGGIWGLQVGYCLMVGGDADAFEHVEPALRTLAPPDGYLYAGGAGAGHFVKMVHNGVEYGMLQAYAEGFEIMQKSQYDLDLHAVSHLWNQGSVVRSWLLELAESAFEKDANLDSIRGYVEDSGEGRWTVLEAINESVPAQAIAGSLFARFASRQDDSFAMKVISALRGEFGGHAIQEASTKYPEQEQ